MPDDSCTSYGQRLAANNGVMSVELLREELASREHTILKLRVRLAELARQLDASSQAPSPKQARNDAAAAQLKEALKRAKAAEVRVAELEAEVAALRARPEPEAPTLDYTELKHLRKNVQATLEEAKRKLEQWWVANESSARRELGKCADGVEAVLQKLQRYEEVSAANGGTVAEEMPTMSMVGNRMSVPCTKPRMAEVEKLSAQHSALSQKINLLRGALGLEQPPPVPQPPAGTVPRTELNSAPVTSTYPRKLAEKLHKLPEPKPLKGAVKGKVHNQLRDNDKKAKGTKVLEEVKKILQKHNTQVDMAIATSKPLPPIAPVSQGPVPPALPKEIGFASLQRKQKDRNPNYKLSRVTVDAALVF